MDSGLHTCPLIELDSSSPSNLGTSMHTSIHNPFLDDAYDTLATPRRYAPLAANQSPDVLLGADYRISYSSPVHLNIRRRGRRVRGEGREAGSDGDEVSLEDESSDVMFEVYNSLLDKAIIQDHSTADIENADPFG